MSTYIHSHATVTSPFAVSDARGALHWLHWWGRRRIYLPLVGCIPMYLLALRFLPIIQVLFTSTVITVSTLDSM